MTRSGLLLCAAASLWLVGRVPAATRPHYGGALRAQVQAAPASLDPADSSAAWANSSLSRLIFDTLVVLDGRGMAQPSLAGSWQAQPGKQRWQFFIRAGVTFQDGRPVSPDAVAASLRAANPSWKVFAAAEAVVIECQAPAPDLPAVLALARNGIARREGGKTIGSGPFAVSQWDPGKGLLLTARDDYWGGRAFVDTIEIELGKSHREQLVAFDLGRSDAAEVAPDQARRVALEGRRVEASAPVECVALVFKRDAGSQEERKLRFALGLSIDRQSINTVLLQGGGDPAGTLLPERMTGYAFLFPAGADLQRAQQLRSEVSQVAVWTLGYDGADPLVKVVAERIVLNAHDAGLILQSANPASADVRLVRVRLRSLNARVALAELTGELGLPQPSFTDDSTSSLYMAEKELLESQRLIPVLHLRRAVAVGGRVRNWEAAGKDGWPLQNVWIGTEKP